MTPEQAHFLAQSTLDDAARERVVTRKVLAAVPADKGEYRPDPVSMTALDLAWHLAAAEVFFLDGVTNGAFAAGGKRPDSVKTPGDVVTWYVENCPAAIARAKTLAE